MANKRARHQPPHWKGDEVEPRPGATAEDAADRAEGNQRVRADAEAERLHHAERAEIPEPRAAPSDADPEDDIREAAEEHRERQDAEGYPPRGKL
jgi:hypothetical protein